MASCKKGEVTMNYTEIFALKDMLERAKIPFVWKELKDFFNGFQICYPKDSKECVCSVIEHKFSYGNEEDLLEIMGLLTKKESEHDCVLGYLTADNVYKRIKKHYKRGNI